MSNISQNIKDFNLSKNEFISNQENLDPEEKLFRYISSMGNQKDTKKEIKSMINDKIRNIKYADFEKNKKIITNLNYEDKIIDKSLNIRSRGYDLRQLEEYKIYEKKVEYKKKLIRICYFGCMISALGVFISIYDHKTNIYMKNENKRIINIPNLKLYLMFGLPFFLGILYLLPQISREMKEFKKNIKDNIFGIDINEEIKKVKIY